MPGGIDKELDPGLLDKALNFCEYFADFAADETEYTHEITDTKGENPKLIHQEKTDYFASYRLYKWKFNEDDEIPDLVPDFGDGNWHAISRYPDALYHVHSQEQAGDNIISGETYDFYKVEEARKAFLYYLRRIPGDYQIQVRPRGDWKNG